ncbi:hypothetical protein M413DRAFT_50830, partial [Hebeloma cylindrosporum]
AARTSIKPLASSVRVFSTTLRTQSGGPPSPQIYGTGGKPGAVPTDFEQATGLERLQLLGDMEGINVFDDSPLDSSRLGTKTNPVMVQCLDTERIVGCTGVPADSHDILWFNLKKDQQARCTECGSVYALDFQGEEHADHH